MKNDNDHTVTLTQALQDIKKEQGKSLILNVNHACHYSIIQKLFFPS